MKIRLLLSTLLLLIIISPSLFADYTYFDYDKLVFGNAGGFELVPTDDGTYVLQVLNISGSDSEYISKGFSLDGKMMSVIPTTGNAYAQSDYMEMGNTDTFTLATIPQVSGQNFPTDRVLLVGEYYGNFMLFNENTIAGYAMVTENSYKSAPIYFQEDYGNFYMGKTSENLPVLSIFPSIDSKAYVGINTSERIKMLTVSGNLRVDGRLKLNKPLGLIDSEFGTNSVLFDTMDQTLAAQTLEFTIPGPVSQNVAIFATTDTLDNNYGAYMTSYFTLEYKNESNSWVTYTTIDIPQLSKRSNDGGGQIGSFPMNPFIAIELPPNEDGSDRDYRVNLILKKVDPSTGGFYYLSYSKLLIIGLGEGNFSDLTTPAYLPEPDIPEIQATSLTELDGNYITDQLLSFGSGGGIVESGHNIIFTKGEGYINFRASALSYGEYHSVDSLKIINDATKYPFQVGDTATNTLGLAPYSLFYTGVLSTQNIQTLTAEVAADLDLLFESDVYIADTFKVLTNGTISPNVEIGNVISDTSVMLNVEDDILFTGSFTGDGILMDFGYINPGNYSGDYFEGSNYANLGGDSISMTLPSGTNWEVGIFIVASSYYKDKDGHNAVWPAYSDGSNTYDFKEVQMYVDDSNINSGHMFNFHTVSLPGGATYEFMMKYLSKDFTNGSPVSTLVDHDNNGSYESSISVYSEGAYIGVIAIPSN